MCFFSIYKLSLLLLELRVQNEPLQVATFGLLLTLSDGEAVPKPAHIIVLLQCSIVTEAAMAGANCGCGLDQVLDKVH